VRIAAGAVIVFLAGCGTTRPQTKPVAPLVHADTLVRREHAEPARTPEQQAVWARAVEHTNRGRAARADADAAKTEADLIKAVCHALVEYEAAIVDWEAYLQLPPPLPVMNATFWLSDARAKVMRIEYMLHAHASVYPEPLPSALALAQRTSVLARDTETDSDLVLAAAADAVALADIRAELAYEHGLHKQTELRTDSEGHVIQMPMPPVVVATIEAEDAYTRAAERLHKNDDLINENIYDAADLFFVYGDFKNATPRFESLYKDLCHKNQIAFKAWTKLITMAARADDITRARELAEADAHETCDLSVVRKPSEHFQPDPDPWPALPFVELDREFVAVCGRDLRTVTDECDPLTPKNVGAWKKLGESYERVLDAAPRIREAPILAFRGAFAFRRASESARAAAMLEKFIREYGAAEILDKLKKEDPKQYDERVGFLTQAYNELMTARYAGFDYRGAADVALRAAKDARLKTDARLESARNALILLRAVGDRTALDGAWHFSTTLKSSPEAAAKNEYIAASDAALPLLWEKDKRIPSVALDVAWDEAKHSDATKARVWFSRVLDAWQALDEPKRAAVCERAAEAEYVLADASIVAITPSNVSTSAAMLEKLAKTCPSSPFVAVALAREGALYESLGKPYEDRMRDAYTRAVDAANASNANDAMLTHARRKLGTFIGLPATMPVSGAASPLPVLLGR
jgi:hypothetical protein